MTSDMKSRDEMQTSHACTSQTLRSDGMRVPRQALVRPLLAAAISGLGGFVGIGGPAIAADAPAVVAAPPSTANAVVTQRVYLDLRIITRFDVEVLEDAAVRGRLVLGLYGKDAPLAVERFVEFVQGTTGQYAKSAGGPSYAQAAIEKLRPGELIEGGRISGLKQATFAGSLEWQYMSRMLPNLRPILEVNELRHDRRGLLSIERFSDGGPEFGLTLGKAPQFDNTREVIGGVESGDDLLQMVEELPYITGKSLDAPGSVADEVYKAQKAIFGGLSKTVGDTRAEDRTGKLLRRVEITACGLM